VSLTSIPPSWAHLDQVHDDQKYYRIIQDDDVLFGWNGKTQVGCGGDDLVGVWLAIEVLIERPYAKVAFFVDEEVGCVGSSAADISFFADSAFILQGDRNQYTYDWINHTNGVDVSTDEFDAAVSKIMAGYGYSFNDGSITDVGELVVNGAGCCAANIACGYHHAHSDKEIVYISEADNCLNLILDVIEQMGYQRWEMDTPVPYYGKYYGKYSTYPKYGSSNADAWQEYFDEYYGNNGKPANKNAKPPTLLNGRSFYDYDEDEEYGDMPFDDATDVTHNGDLNAKEAWLHGGEVPQCTNPQCGCVEPMQYYHKIGAFYCDECGNAIDSDTFEAIDLSLLAY
jgi:hypothetical protein